MSLAQLRASLAIWRRRNSRRQAKLDVAHERNDTKGIVKWTRLRREAGDMIERRLAQIDAIAGPRQRAVAKMELSALRYRQNPRAYHYKAGGVSNTVIMKPTPFDWRSDCSQWAVNVDREAGLPCPGSGTFKFSNTTSIAAGRGAHVGRVTTKPKAGDYALYGSRWNPHHVERVRSVSRIFGVKYLGHGTQPIDGITPGPPSYYLTFDYLEAA